MQPFCGRRNVVIELLPFLLRIAVPDVRVAAASLLDATERKRMDSLVSIYQRYGLQFEEGASRDDDPHVFHLKPYVVMVWAPST